MEMNIEEYNLILPEDPPQKISFLLRCTENRGQESEAGEQASGWLFALQDTKSDAVYRFKDLTALTAFLQDRLTQILEDEDQD